MRVKLKSISFICFFKLICLANCAVPNELKRELTALVRSTESRNLFHQPTSGVLSKFVPPGRRIPFLSQHILGQSTVHLPIIAPLTNPNTATLRYQLPGSSSEFPYQYNPSLFYLLDGDDTPPRVKDEVFSIPLAGDNTGQIPFTQSGVGNSGEGLKNFGNERDKDRYPPALPQRGTFGYGRPFQHSGENKPGLAPLEPLSEEEPRYYRDNYRASIKKTPSPHGPHQQNNDASYGGAYNNGHQGPLGGPAELNIDDHGPMPHFDDAHLDNLGPAHRGPPPEGPQNGGPLHEGPPPSVIGLHHHSSEDPHLNGPGGDQPPYNGNMNYNTPPPYTPGPHDSFTTMRPTNYEHSIEHGPFSSEEGNQSYGHPPAPPKSTLSPYILNRKRVEESGEGRDYRGNSNYSQSYRGNGDSRKPEIPELPEVTFDDTREVGPIDILNDIRSSNKNQSDLKTSADHNAGPMLHPSWHWGHQGHEGNGHKDHEKEHWQHNRGHWKGTEKFEKHKDKGEGHEHGHWNHGHEQKKKHLKHGHHAHKDHHVKDHHKHAHHHLREEFHYDKGGGFEKHWHWDRGHGFKEKSGSQKDDKKDHHHKDDHGHYHDEGKHGKQDWEDGGRGHEHKHHEEHENKHKHHQGGHDNGYGHHLKYHNHHDHRHHHKHHPGHWHA